MLLRSDDARVLAAAKVLHLRIGAAEPRTYVDDEAWNRLSLPERGIWIEHARWALDAAGVGTASAGDPTDARARAKEQLAKSPFPGVRFVSDYDWENPGK